MVRRGSYAYQSYNRKSQGKINEETVMSNIPKTSVIIITCSTNEQISEAPTLDQASDTTFLVAIALPACNVELLAH